MLEVGARSRRPSRSWSCATPTSCSPAAPERFADELARRGASGLIVPDLPLEEAGGTLAACDAAGLALVPLVAPTTPDERLAAIGARARGFLYTVSVTGTTGERGSLGRDLPDDPGPRQGRDRRAGRARVRHRRRPRRRPPRPRAGADGVIVGSRLVRAAAESERPADAVRELVAGFAAAPPVGSARRMGILLTTIAGLVVWIVLWALGVKSFDAFLITVLMVVIAATAHIFAPYLPGNRCDD